jgi:hypothetical protein
MGTGLTGLCPVLALDQGELAYVQGELLCALVVCALFLSMVFCLRCVEPLPLPKGSETCLLQVISFFAFLGFRSLVRVFLFGSLLFSFSLYSPNVCVVNALIKGRLRTMCGSRTGGWSLPCVMSD